MTVVTVPSPVAVGTVSAGTAMVTTAVASTVVPAGTSSNSTAPPFPTEPPATPIPTLPSGASPTELKYQVLAQFPDLFFCDPDFYPVARADEADLARQRFPDLQANPEEFQAILNHNGLSGVTTFTDEQKLLIYREHKKLAAVRFEPAGDGYQFELQTADANSQGFIVAGLIDGAGTIAVQSREPTIATCPICLAGGTRIDTPHGPMAVEDLRAGDVVWTVDGTGTRLAASLLNTVRVPVPAGHLIIHLVLDDGRELWASPGHPTTDGRALGDLRPGDQLDGARVARLERVLYHQPATYDVLPSGGTGFYWANGILIGSTLAQP